MRRLVIMHVTNGGNMLNHSPMCDWPVFSDIHPVRVEIQLGDERYYLRTLRGYNHRGGVNNSAVGRWINYRYGDTHNLKLLFEVLFDEQSRVITYKLRGKIIPV